ncbi:Glycerol-3-phosphate dehydrogenase [NAD(P)+] [Candidatus Profftia lariciata]|uniref:NAD(P)H-dependent glycerol-3-phosphate dehydrogenase n=1 Tax=Candidatus Profftia lariciata TaxID=1987921 RepID=UPI001D0303EF|nr:NAD(P)H-dependent glycerol-3-phosphate dehydrogenase [Candidatus Profftia lariciata]UDG81540.1 Glycerol-3-phosphate dehydrogenase [NAD(P)+] [Candidatus Profftia lariciata]
MNNDITSITILGAGAYGTALAIALARNGHKVCLWGHNTAHIKLLHITRCNKKFLPDILFPNTLYLETNLAKAISANRDILIVVPSHVFSEVIYALKPYLKDNSRIVWATKGLEAKTGNLLQDVTRQILGPFIPLAAISGPTFAKEIADGLPTAIVLSSTDMKFTRDLQQLLHCNKNFRVYSNPDLIGVQLGGVVKNIIAIGAGMSDGIGFGSNARTALITRGLTEMSRLGVALGADSMTFMGMSGLGDLVLTCTDNRSRNRRFGIMLGQGHTIQAAQDKIGQVIEGYRNTKEVIKLAKRYNIEMPITEQVYEVLYCKKDIHKAAITLLNRAQKTEKE